MSNVRHMTSKDVIVKVPVAVVKIGPLGFHHYAAQFLAAARSVGLGPAFSPVPYYLYCRSLELSLKAYLLAKAVPMKELKNPSILGHNLENILGRAETLGLASVVHLNKEERQEVMKANAYYAGKGFEYFYVGRAMTGYRNLPDLTVLEQMANRLVEKLEAVCLAAA